MHHFKWHSGVGRSLADRVRHYRGDDLEKPCGQAGAPRFKAWRESERLMEVGGGVTEGRSGTGRVGQAGGGGGGALARRSPAARRGRPQFTFVGEASDWAGPEVVGWWAGEGGGSGCCLRFWPVGSW